MGAAAIVAALERLRSDGALAGDAAAGGGRHLCRRRSTRADAALDWTQPAAALDRIVRAFDPAPGALHALGAR